MNGTPTTYYHVQRAPLCLFLYGLAVMFLVLAWVLRDPPPIRDVFPIVGVLVFVLATSLHHLTVSDESDRLSIRFGPLPLLRRNVRYEHIESVEVGKTTLLDGWGIHLSLRGGWVWNLWGWDCVVLRLRKGTLRVGTDDAENLARFVENKISEK